MNDEEIIKKEISNIIKKRIDELMIKNNYSANKLAKLSLLTQSTIQNILNGKSKNTKILTLIRICSGLKINLSEFFKHEDFNLIQDKMNSDYL